MPPNLSVQNDGTVWVLMTHRPRGLHPISLNGSGNSDPPGLDRREASSDRSGPLADDYVEMLVLDYLTGNLVRSNVDLDEARGRLVLTDNAYAFAQVPDGGVAALAQKLAAIRRVRRFPEGLASRLRALDAAHVDGALRVEGQWLVPRRSVVMMMDRRETLLSLVDALARVSPERVDGGQTKPSW